MTYQKSSFLSFLLCHHPVNLFLYVSYGHVKHFQTVYFYSTVITLKNTPPKTAVPR